jgi:hypothetical protein
MSIVDLDPQIAADNLHKKPFRLRHNLADHPLFQLPQLVELAGQLPRGFVEFNSGDLDVGHAAEDTPKLDLEPAEIVKDIENNHAWMVLKRVDTIPEYMELLEQFVADLFEAAGTPEQPYTDLEGFIFVASANSTTPFHADAEENILAHIRGTKIFHIFNNDDRALLSEESLELSPSNYRNQSYDTQYEDRATEFILNPGDGVHVPYLNPHWVKTGDNFGVSMAMTWKTPEVIRMNKIRLMNGTLRRFGMPQQAPGISPGYDGVKVFIHDAARLVLDPIRKTDSARRFIRRLIYGKKANYYYDSR